MNSTQPPRRARRARLLAVAALALIGAVALGFFGFNAWAAATGPRVADVANSRFTADDGTIVAAYNAKPAVRKLRPGILLVHEWWGLDAETAAKADRLRDLGYAVFAPDTYRGQVTDRVARALWLRLTVPEDRVVADLDAAVKHLQGIDTVDPERIVVLGFCYGGEMAMRYGVTNDRLVGIADFYGKPVLDKAALSMLAKRRIPVLGVFGEQDRRLGPEVAKGFDDALTQAGVPHEITVYPGVDHAFVKTTALDTPGPAADAWAQLVAWLEGTTRK